MTYPEADRYTPLADLSPWRYLSAWKPAPEVEPRRTVENVPEESAHSEDGEGHFVEIIVGRPLLDDGLHLSVDLVEMQVERFKVRIGHAQDATATPISN